MRSDRLKLRPSSLSIIIIIPKEGLREKRELQVRKVRRDILVAEVQKEWFYSGKKLIILYLTKIFEINKVRKEKRVNKESRVPEVTMDIEENEAKVENREYRERQECMEHRESRPRKLGFYQKLGKRQQKNIIIYHILFRLLMSIFLVMTYRIFRNEYERIEEQFEELVRQLENKGYPLDCKRP